MASITSPSSSSPQPSPNTTPAFRAEDFTNDGKTHTLLGVSGSVAAIKLPNIIRGLHTSQASIRIILTPSATHFFSGTSPENPSLSSLSSLPGVEGVYVDADEWNIPWQRGHAILHIELRKWADVMLVVPLDANTLAKMTTGLADNLLTSVLRAWDPNGLLNPLERKGRRKELLVAPAMNTAMWLHPVTKAQIRLLTETWRVRDQGWGVDVTEDGERREEGMRSWARMLLPKEKELACGDVGVGAMMEWQDIVQEVLAIIKQYE